MSSTDALQRSDSPRPGDEIAPSRYCKLPVEIEAIRWSGHNLRQVIDFTGLHHSAEKWTWDEYAEVVRTQGFKIFSLEGPHLVSVGDYVIKGVKGEFYACKPDIFCLTYRRAIAAAPPTTKPSSDPVPDAPPGYRHVLEKTTSLKIALTKLADEIDRYLSYMVCITPGARSLLEEAAPALRTAAASPPPSVDARAVALKCAEIVDEAMDCGHGWNQAVSELSLRLHEYAATLPQNDTPPQPASEAARFAWLDEHSFGPGDWQGIVDLAIIGERALRSDGGSSKVLQDAVTVLVAKIDDEPLRTNEPGYSVDLGRAQVADELRAILKRCNSQPQPSPSGNEESK